MTSTDTQLLELVTKNDWRGLVNSYLKVKVDYKLRYFFIGSLHNQEDRDWVAQAAAYYNGRTKRQKCPASDVVSAELPNFVQGYTHDLDANIAPIVTFKTTKHILGFMTYLATTRYLHNDIIVKISVDDSPFIEII